MTRYQTPVLDPTAIPQVALPLMNDTHQEEVELINQLGSLLEAGLQGTPDEAAIGEKFQQWIAHTREHFARENELMQEYRFFAYPMHSGEHEQVLNHLEKLYQQWQENKDIPALAKYVFEIWPEWFAGHVNSMDTVTAQFLEPLVGE